MSQPRDPSSREPDPSSAQEGASDSDHNPAEIPERISAEPPIPVNSAIEDVSAWAEYSFDSAEELGRGGMALVHRAEDRAFGRTVAVKRMLEPENLNGARRFLTEARITARLEHPNIVPVHAIGADADGHPFYSMKLVRGRDFASVLKSIAEGDAATLAEYPLSALLGVFQKVCDAVAFAHSQRIVHRDLKPANIMLGAFGEVLVMDWGIARDLSHPEADPSQPSGIDASIDGTAVGAVIGTLYYMSPEQARGEVYAHDARSDIWSLGAILYEILALRRPVSSPARTHGPAAYEILLQRVAKAQLDPLIPPPSGRQRADSKLRHLPGGTIPESLAAIVQRAMASAPEHRYQSVRELQRDLTAYQSGFATVAEKAGLFRQIALALRRHRREATIAGALLLVLFIGAIVSFVRIAAERDRARASEKAAQASEAKAVASRKAADELIRYMQYDLRGTLGKIGRLSLMDSIDGRIARYYVMHPPDLSDLGAVHDRGIMMQQRGDALLAGGNLAEAQIAYQAVLAFAYRLVAAEPKNPAWQRDLSVGYEKIGDVQRAQGLVPDALGFYRKSLAIREHLTQQDPANAVRQRDLAVSYDNVGDVLRDQGQLAAALASYQQSLAVAERLAQKAPTNAGWQHGLAVSYSKVGDVQRLRSQLPDALGSFQESVAIFERLAQQDPGNAGRQRDLSVGYDRVGDIHSAQGRLPAALGFYQKSLGIRERLAQQDPANADWQRDLSVSYGRVGVIQRAQGLLPDALVSYNQSLSIAERLAQKDPANAGWQRDLAVSYEGVGSIAQLQKRWTEAANAFAKEADTARPWLERENVDVQWLSAFTYGTGKLWDVLRDAPPGEVKLDRDALLADLRLARTRLQALKAENRLVPPADKYLPVIERLLAEAQHSAPPTQSTEK